MYWSAYVSTIHHIAHNSPRLTPQNLHKQSIVFNFSWDGCNTQEKLKTMVMQNCGGKRGKGEIVNIVIY